MSVDQEKVSQMEAAAKHLVMLASASDRQSFLREFLDMAAQSGLTIVALLFYEVLSRLKQAERGTKIKPR